MEVSICPVLFDIEAPLLVDRLLPSSDIDRTIRRVSRVATLDLSASFYDAGYTPADRTAVISVAIEGRTDPMFVLARKFAQSYAEITLAFHEGVFVGSISQIYISNGVLNITILLKSAATQ